MPPRGRMPVENRLLAGMPARVGQRLVSHGELVELAPGEILCTPGEPISHVYFPVETFVAMVAPMADGGIQVGMVGNEGVVSASVALGVSNASLRGLVQCRGTAWRIGVAPFLREVDRSPVLRQVLNRYLCVLIGQLAQNSGCTRFHLVEARLARWLLMARDRAHGNQFFITHELLSDMLGVRRVGVTNAASALQADKLISYSRGKVTILNNRGLEAVACECYRGGKLMYESVLG